SHGTGGAVPELHRPLAPGRWTGPGGPRARRGLWRWRRVDPGKLACRTERQRGRHRRRSAIPGVRTAAGLRAWTHQCDLHRGDFREFVSTRQFDAVVGRFVLMYQGEPGPALAYLAGLVRPGGVVVFQEQDFHCPHIARPEAVDTW